MEADTDAAPRPDVPARLLFVGGLHRSGTSLVHRCLSAHPDVSGFSGTGVSEDEGQHLQRVYPPDYRSGGAGLFAFGPGAHLTERSPLASSRSRDRLLAAWGPHWRPGAAVGVEKSPPNLIRSRLLQALFPEAVFVMVVRHPVAVACATQKGRRRLLSYGALVRHWVACHTMLAEDAPHVRSLHVIRYERLVSDPSAVLAPAFAAVGVEPCRVAGLVRTGIDEGYFARWRSARNPARRIDRDRTVRRYEAAVGRFGYSLVELERSEPGTMLAGLSS
jgi:Sulfotransferase family